MSLVIVMTFEQTRHSCNSYSSYVDNTSITKVVNIGSNPSTIGQFLQVVRSFMIASNKQRQDGSFYFPTVVPVLIE